MCPILEHKYTKEVFGKTIVAIGTSTGGPRALEQVLMNLSGDFSSPILIVQHMPARFTKSLADRLDSLTNIHVKEAVHGDILRDNTAYIAPGDFHMKTRRDRKSIVIELTKDVALRGHRPSVDVLFESVADLQQINTIAVILTGMGSDGAHGIKRLKEADANTIIIAEDEASAIVYGMPNAAIKTNCVDHILPLKQVGGAVERFAREEL